MKFLRVLFWSGYLFFGSFCLYAIWQLMTVNAWFDLFPLKNTFPTEITFDEVQEGTSIITFTYDVDGELFTNSRRVINSLIDERLNKNPDDIMITYNSVFPQVSFLSNLKMEKRSGYVELVTMGFFILLFLVIDLFANKRKWLSIYGIPE